MEDFNYLFFMQAEEEIASSNSKDVREKLWDKIENQTAYLVKVLHILL